MDRCVVRQPIKEMKTEKVVGYELLFQGGSDSFYDETETSVADTISGFLLNNSSKITSDKPVFITFTPSLLFRNTPKMFEKDKVIIQIEDNLIIHPLSMPIIKRYCNEGYALAINDFQFSPKYFSILEYASYIRISVSGKSEQTSSKERNSLDNIVKMAQGFGKKCIATGVDSPEEHEFAVKLGVDFLEGNYVARSLVSKVEKVQYMQGNFFQLVVAVSKDEPDMAEIEDIVSRDAGLTFALLKLVNSAFFALRRRTASIRQALVTLGIGQLRQWVYMLSFNQEGDESSEEILKLSFLRAKFASDLSEKVRNCSLTKNDAYMMGMFSTLEYMVNASPEEILSEIPVNQEIKDALLKKEGVGGTIYQLILTYEKADWKESRGLAEALDVPTKILAQMYINCVEEVNAIWRDLVTDYARPGESKVFEGIDDKKEHIEDVLF